MGIREHLSKKSLDLSTEWDAEKAAGCGASTETYKPINEDLKAELKKDAAPAADKAKLAAKRDEVTFIKAERQNDDAKIDLTCIAANEEKAITTKEELLKYVNDPFWVRLRWICFMAFWVIWLGMLIGAILIMMDTPKCAVPEPLPWYRRGIFAKFGSLSELAIERDVKVAKSMHVTGVVYGLPRHWMPSVQDPEMEETIRSVVSAYKDSGVHVILDVMLNATADAELAVNDTSQIQDALKRLVDFGVRGIRLKFTEEGITVLEANSLGDAFIIMQQINTYPASTADTDGSLRSLLLGALNAAAGNATQLQWELADFATGDLKLPPSALIWFLSLLPGGVPVVPAMPNAAALMNITEHTYKHIERLRSSVSYMHGAFKTHASSEILAYSRHMYGSPGYFVAVNPTDSLQRANFSRIDLPPKMTVDAVSDNYDGIKVKSKLSIAALELSPFSTIVLTYVPVKQ